MATLPIIIIGAGPTGLVAANLLGKAGIETLIIERNEVLCSFPRAIVIDDEGLRVCQATGLIDEILAHVRLNVKAHYLSKGHFLAKVAPTSQKNGYPLITTFHQSTLEHILLEGLKRFSHVKVLFQHTLEALEQDEHGVYISVRTPDSSLTQLACSYLLACDGGKSSVRRMLAIPMRSPTVWHTKKSVRNIDDEQKWLVVDSIGASEPSDAILFFCDPPRPAVSVPGPDQQRRWEFMLLPNESEEMLQTATIQHLIRSARSSMPREFYASSTYAEAPLQIVRQTIYTFHALIATKFMQGRVFLLGDAAHLMPPFGGQGMNSGLRDAHNLCWKLQMALQSTTQSFPTEVGVRGGVEGSGGLGLTLLGRKISTLSRNRAISPSRVSPRPPLLSTPPLTPTPEKELLASYQVERYGHTKQMIIFSSLLGSFIMTRHRLLALLRNLFFQRIINRISPVREALTEMRVKPQPHYTHGFLLKGHRKEERTLVGVMLPQPYILTTDSEQVRLDEVLGDGFALVALYKEPHEVHMKIRIYPMRTSLCEQPICVLDSEDQISTFMNYRCDLYVLVRPDRYIMGVFKTEQKT